MRLACVDCRLCRRQFGTDFSGGGDCVAVAQVQRSAMRLRRRTSCRVSPKSFPARLLTRPAIHRAPCGEPGARHDALRVVATLRDSACVAASEGGGRFVPRNERARRMRACRSARVDFSRMLTVGSAGATALPSSQTQTSIGRAAQDPQSRCAQRAEAASVCSGLRRDAEHAFDRTSRMPGSRGWVTKPAWCRSAHLAANGAGLPRRETAATGAPNAIKVRGACAARVRDAAHARCETHITGSRHARSKCATRPIRDATQPLALCLDRSDAERDRRRSAPVTERVGLHVRLRAEQPYEASDRLSAKRDTNSANAGDFSYTPIHFVATVFRAMLRIKSDAPCMLSRPADRHFSVCEAPKSDR